MRVKRGAFVACRFAVVDHRKQLECVVAHNVRDVSIITFHETTSRNAAGFGSRGARMFSKWTI